MSRLAVVVWLSAFTGWALLLTEIRWFRRPRLGDRLRPYAPAATGPKRTRAVAADSLAEVLTPIATDLGAFLARLAGASEDLEIRLRRVHAPVDPTGFRVRQFARTGTALVVGTGMSVALTAPPVVAILLSLGTPVLVFLWVEQRLARESEEWQRRLSRELPVVCEQLGMLLAAGWSLGSALHRIGERGRGACASDLRRVSARVRHGLPDAEALREWAATSDVAAVQRLVDALTLNRDAVDLDRLITQEARAMRRDAHRATVETIEKRSQQVWVPVTVAALVPGVLLMGVPFLDALTLFSSS